MTKSGTRDEARRESEAEWARRLADRLKRPLRSLARSGSSIDVLVGRRLAYRLESLSYSADNAPELFHASSYQTDVLIAEVSPGKSWTPRVVVETKLGQISTHDALTYSAKAATHKQVHPHLRYGILIGDHGEARVPSRLIRHGAHFDFMAAWRGVSGNRLEWQDLTKILIQEVDASRQLESLVRSARSRDRRPVRLLHRPLVLGRGNRPRAKP